jgi:hypothetical protein
LRGLHPPFAGPEPASNQEDLMTLTNLLLVLTITILLGMLAAIKTGFNQVIRGLEALQRQSGAER